MARIFTTRRSQWAPGVAGLAAAAGIGALLGSGLVSTPVALGALALVAGAFVAGWVRRLWLRRHPHVTSQGRTRLKVLREGKSVPYDLESDDSTDSQRYLM